MRLRKLWILPFFLSSVVWAEKTYEVQLKSDINLRAPLREVGQQQEVVKVVRTLPKGTIIRVSEKDYKSSVMLSMQENKDKFPWIQGVEVVSIPGESETNVKKLNETPNLISYNLVHQTGKVVKVTDESKDVQLTKPTDLMKQSFKSSITNEKAIRVVEQVSATAKAIGPNTKCDNCDIKEYSRDTGKLYAPSEYKNQQASTGLITSKEEMMKRLKDVSRRFTEDTSNDSIYEFDNVAKAKAAQAYALSKISTKPIQQTLDFIDKNFDKLPNRRYVTVIDYTKPSNTERGYLFDLETGTTTTFLVRQGVNAGDPPKEFSNVVGSYKTPRGFHVVGDVELCAAPYYRSSDCADNLKGSNFMRLHGQEGSLNSNSGVQRGILIHSGGKNLQGEAKRGSLARSNGCPSMDDAVFNKYHKQMPGSLYFMYSDTK